MGIFDKIGSTIKETGKNISQEIERRQEIVREKKRLLTTFEMADLKGICKAYGIGEPSNYEEDPFSGKRSKRTLTREHYTGFILNRLTLEQIQNFKNRHPIKRVAGSSKPRAKEKENTSKKDSPIQTKREANPAEKADNNSANDDFDQLLKGIEKEFEPEDVRDENDLEKQITQYLKIKYPGKVRRQVETVKGKIDLVIDNKYAIELKIADGKGKLRDLVGQIHSYKKVYTNVAIVLLDVGRMQKSEINEYIEDYSNFGARTIVLEGVLKRRKGRSRRIILES